MTKANVSTKVSIRMPAKEAMANRRRVTFGASYLNGVINGVHRDQDKMIIHARALKLGSMKALSALKLETLRERLAKAIIAAPEGSLPTSITIN